MTTSAKKTEIRYRTFEAIYHGPTNTLGSRITIADLRLNQRVTIPFDYSSNDATDIARKYLEGKGIEISGLAMLNNSCLLLSKDFTTEIN